MKSKQWRVVGKINGTEVIKEFDHEYSAEQCAKMLNDTFAPFSVEKVFEGPPPPPEPEPQVAEDRPF